MLRWSNIAYAIAFILAAFLSFPLFNPAIASASVQETSNISVNLTQPQLEVSSHKPVVGELVAITVRNAKETQLVISAEATSFRYLTPAQTILFKPAKQGLYEVLLVNATNASDVLASTSFEAVPEPWRVWVEKATYQAGELVRITAYPPDVEFAIMFNNNTYQLLGSSSNGSVEFVPKQEGTYAVTAYYQNETFTVNLTANFTVVSAKDKDKAGAKAKYNSTGYVGDAINITADAEYVVSVQTPSERFNYLNLNKALSFTPVEEGNYTIQLIKAGVAEDTVTIFVKAAPPPEQQPELAVETFALSKDVRLLLNFTELAKRHASFLDRMFRRSPIAQVTAYVQGYETDPRFGITLSPVEKDVFELKLYSNSQIQPGKYKVILQTQLHYRQLNQSYEFLWVSQPTEAEEEVNIFEHVNHSFSSNSSVIFMLSLTDKLPFPRSLLDVLLRRSRLDALVLYVEGQENNTFFAPKAKHVTNDDFEITIPWDEKIRPDVYKLVSIALAGGAEYRVDNVFNWGLTNKDLIIEKANALRKATITNKTPYLPQPEQEPLENQTKITVKSDVPLSYTTRFINYSANSTNTSIGELAITFTTSAPLKSIVMHNFTLNVSFKEGAIGIATGSVKAPKHAKPAYAIDPSFFTFDSIGITATATTPDKSELYVCYNYNFSNSSCEQWQPYANLTKGQQYEINLTKTIAVAFAEIQAQAQAAVQEFKAAGEALTAGTAQPKREPLLVYREQETRTRPNVAVHVRILIATAADNITDAVLTETIPAGWSLYSLPSLPSLPENATQLSSTGFTVPISSTEAGLTVLNYSANSPASASAAATAAFTSTVTATINQSPTTKSASTQVLVDEKNTPFVISATINGKMQRRIATNLTHSLKFSITRLSGSSASSVTTHPVLFTWPYNSSAISIESVDKGCENQKQYMSGISAVKCVWRSFSQGQTKEFTATLKPLAELVHTSTVNTTYDPPRIETAVMKDAPYKVYFTAKTYNQDLLLDLWHNANATLQISVSSEALLSRQAISQNEKASILVQDYKNEYFTVTVGEEIISFGESPIAIAPAETKGAPITTSAAAAAAKTKTEKEQKEKEKTTVSFVGKIASGVKNAVVKAVKKTVSSAKKVFGTLKSAFSLRVTGFAVLKETGETGTSPHQPTAAPAPAPPAEPQQQTVADEGPRQQPQPAAEEQPKPKPEPKPRQQQFFTTEPGKGSGDTARPTQPAPVPEAPKPKARKEWFPTYKDLTLILEDFTPQLDTTAIISRNVQCSRCDNFTAPENTEVNITVTAYNFKQTANRLTEYVPVNWNITSAAGGITDSHNSTHNKIAWNISAQYFTAAAYSARSPDKSAIIYPFAAELGSGSEKAYGENHPILIEPFSLAVKDAANSSLNATVRITRVKEEKPGFVIVDLEVKVEEKEKFAISFSNVTIQKGANASFAIEQLGENQTKTANFVKLYSIDTQSLNFSSAEVTATATGSALQKCANWNFAEQRCRGSWAKLLDLFPGQTYTFTLTPGDPGYAETGLATINTNKSIYHLGEHAKLTAVVLDTSGHLVSSAAVEINVTSPIGEVETFTTANSTVTETERGIYEATYTSTTENGTYLLTVSALGPGVNSTLNSHFAAQEFYEFDILRKTPVTTDPFTAPFTTELTVISYVNETTEFNLTETLPHNFTITDYNTAAIYNQSNKTHLTWKMQNATTVNYTARPPLVTPELWELQSFVTYASGAGSSAGSKNFTEARPWLLAVDPAFQTANWSVQGGTVPVDSTLDHVNATINRTILNNSFIVFRQRMGPDEDPPTEGKFYAVFLNETLLQFRRFGTASAGVSIDYYVISSPEIYVQNGTVSYTNTQSLRNVSINPVNINKTIVVAEASCDSTNQVDWHESFWSGNMTNSTNVRLFRQGESVCDGTVGFFAVEFRDNSTIQQGQINFSGVKAEVNISPVNLTTSFLIFEKTCDATADRQEECGVKGNITNATQLVFERTIAAGRVMVQWYTISNPNFRVQKGEIGPLTGATTSAALSPAVNMSSSFSFVSMSNTAGGTYSRLAWASMIVSDANLSIRRNDTGSNNFISWQVIEFRPPPTADFEAPNVTLNRPNDSESISNDDLSFNWTASDNIADTLTCSVTINGTTNQSGISVANGTSSNLTIWNFNKGPYQWNVTCSDVVGNSNTSSTRTFTTTVNPDEPIRVYKVFDNVFSSDVTEGSGFGPLRSVFTFWNPNPESRNLTFLYDNYTNVDNVVQSFQNTSPATGWATVGAGTGGNVSWNGSYEIRSRDTAVFHYGFFLTAEMGAGASSNNAPMLSYTRDYENLTGTIPHANLDNPELGGPWILTEVSTDNASYDYVANSSSTQSTTYYFRFGEFACTGSVGSGCQAVFTVNLDSGWDVTSCETTNNTLCSDTQVKWEGLPMNGFTDTTCGLPATYFGRQYGFTGIPPAYTTTNYTLINVTLRYCDNNGNQHDTVGEHPVKIVVDSSTPPAITFNDPKEGVTSKNFSGVTNPSSSHTAYEGGTAAGLPPGSADAPINGTEASTQSYVNLTTSNDTRYHTVITTSGQRVYQSFNFKVTQSPTDISKLTVRHEGFATRRTNQLADDFLIYIYNHTSDTYLLIKNNTASSTDVTSTIELTEGFSNYISNSEVWLLVEGNFVVGAGGQGRADMHTDYAVLEVTTLPAISGQQPINVTAIDADGVSSCAYRYENSTHTVTNFTGLNSTGSNYFSNTSDTAVLRDDKYTLRARCFDVPNNQNNVTLNVTVSNAAPAVFLQSPANNTNFTTINNVTFVWNASDPKGGTLTCALGISNKVNASGLASDSNKNTSRTVNNFNDGYQYWNVTCANSGGATNTSQIRNFTVDINAPTVTLDKPASNNFSKTPNLTFTYTPLDGTSIANCSLIVDSAINKTNTTVVNNALNNFTVANFNSRNYSWSVNCTDQFSFTGAGSTRNFTVDPEKPFVNLTAPPNGASLTNGTVQFNFTAFDNLDTVMGCNLTVNNVVQESNIAAANGTVQIRNLTLSDGTKLWNATCVDETDNSNTSETRTFTITGPPDVTLVSPANNSHVRGNPLNVSFTYTPDDGDGLANCSLVINDKINQTNATLLVNGGSNYFNLSNASDQQLLNWTVSCYDLLGSQGNATARVLTIDATPPFVNLTEPPNNFTFTNASVQLNFTTFDNFANNQTCNLTVNSVLEQQSFVVLNNTKTLRNLTLGSGNKLWNATCVDFAGNSNTSQTRNFTVLGAPTVNLQAPANDTVQKGTNLNFSYLVDDLDPVANCSLVINKVINQTNTSAIPIPSTHSFLANLSQRSYNWTVNCTDTSLNIGTDDPFLVTIDATLPWFNLTAPPNATNITNTTLPFKDHSVQFNFTAYDNYNTTMTCNLTVDNAVSSQNLNFNTTNNTFQIRNQTGLAEGGHLWNASCFDTVGNQNTSQTFNFTLDFAPRVKLQSPANGTFTNSTRAFVYNVTDYNSIANCSLMFGGGINTSNTSVTNNANNSFLLQNMNEQKLEWTVQCYDSNNNRGNDTARILYVDATAPSVHARKPNGSIFSSGNSIEFLINATDNNATSMLCDITVNGTVQDNDFAAAANQNTTRTLAISTTGYHIWNATCEDNASLQGVSATLNFTITAGPTVKLLAPANDSADLDGNVTFFYNATDDDIANCSLVINDVVNKSNSTVVVSGAESNLTPESNFSQGQYNWTVNCVDTTNFAGNATPFVLHVDSFAPYLINLTAPANNSNVSKRNVTFNFTAFDAVDTLLGCNLTINGTINQSSINATNGTTKSVLVPGFNVGDYSWNVTCQDNANLTNTSQNFVFRISTLPTVTLQAPVHNFNTSKRSVNFSYVPESVFGIDNCQLFLDPKSNQTDIFIENGQANYFNASQLNEGLHNWSVMCDDTNTPSKSASAGPQNFTVDLTQPFVSLSGPNGTAYNFTVLTFNFTSTDNLGTFGTCNLTVNSTVKASGIYAANATSVNTTATNYTDGLHLWNATCTDPAGNSNASQSMNFTITEPPSMVLGTPDNATRTNITNQTFNFTPFDNSNSISSCAVVFNGLPNETNSSITTGIANYINVQNLSHKEYAWTVNCTDAAGNSRSNATTKILRIDRLGPGIDQNRPTEGQVFNLDDITFNFTATDQFSLATLLDCGIYLDGARNLTQSNVTSGTANITLIENLTIGKHNWSVSCTDDFANLNSTANVTFIVNSPDLTLNDTHIIFNDTNPDEGQKVTVNATIFNIGGNPATNATLQFFDNNGTNETQFNIQNITVEPGQNVTAMANLTITTGMHRIIVALDLEDRIVELNDSNNNASRNISLLRATITSPANGTAQNERNFTINSTVRNFRGANLNFTLFVDGRLNLTNLTFDNLPNITALNFTEGVHTIVAQASESDPLNNATFRSKNSSTVTVTFDQTNPVANITTANNSFFADPSPTVFFNITDNLDPVINYTVYVNATIEDRNYTSNGTLANVTLSDRVNGSYLITVEALDSAGNRVNSTPIVIFVDTAFPSINITTLNNTNFSDLTPEISFNITDNLDSVLNYTVFVDGRKDDNGTRPRGQNTANLTTQQEGEHNITIEALDEAGNRANSTPIRIFIDVTAPTITVDNPTPNDLEGFTVQILTTISDGSGVGVANVSFKIVNDTSALLENDTLQAPGYDTTWNSTQDIDNSTNTYFVNLTVFANDTLGNSNSVRVRFIVDNRNPDITFVRPSQNDFNSSFNLSIVIENYNLTISNYSIFNATARQQNNTNNSIFQASFNWTDLVNLSNLTSYPEALFNITAYAQDSLGNNRTASSYFRVDRTAPNITLETPSNSSNVTGTSLAFNFTAADNFDTSMTCNLTIDNSVEKQNFQAANATLTNATITPTFADGAHFWQIQCLDNAGNRNTTAARNFTYDTKPPLITLNTPANNTANNTRNVSFAYTPTDATTTMANCSILINGTTNKTETNIQNSQANNFTLQNFNEGVYLWNVQCTDVVGNSNISTYNYTLTLDLTSPAANITTANGTAFSTGRPNITINLTDNLDPVINYTMFVNGEKDDNGTVQRGIQTNVTLTFRTNGTYTAIAEAMDDAGNRANSSAINITIDSVKPTISLTAPPNNTKINTTTVHFNFTAFDNLANSFSCDLVIDNFVNTTTAVVNATSKNLSVSNFTAGIHAWNVSCLDNAGNQNTSLTFYFNMTQPDLVITSANITFNTSQFEENKAITITANIYNIGEAEAQNIFVEIINGTPGIGNQIYNATIKNIQPASNATANTTTAFQIGTYNVSVRIDSQNKISESNENNNLANRSLNVPMWNYVYGNVSGEYQLRNDTVSIIYKWIATENSSGNIYLADYDSVVSWNNLTKLGMNRSGNFTITDFEELDTAMNTTGYEDSVNRTYTDSSKQKANGTFIAFATTFTNVPIANSTNNSNFTTGILWDAADDADGEYNGSSSDVVFVTNITRATWGTYGKYDYEIRVPALLRNYKGPDRLAVVFYLELK